MQIRRNCYGKQLYQSLKGKALALLLFFTFLWFMSFTSRSVISPILPFIEDEFGISHGRASSIFVPLSVGYALSLFFSGVYMKLFGPKKSITLSLALGALACFTITFFKLFEFLYLSMFIIGFAGGIYLPSMIPYLTTYYSKGNWGKVIAIHDSGAGISLFTVPFVATALLDLCKWRGVFLVVGLTLMACAIVLFVAAEEKQGLASERQYFGGDIWKRKDVWLLGIVGTCMGGSTMGLYYIIPLYLVKEVGVTPSQANTILGMSRIGGVLLAISMGYVVDRFSPRKLMFTLAFLGGIATMSLINKNLVWIEICFFIQACFTMAFMPLMFFGVSKLFKEQERSQATAILLTVSLAFGGMIPYLLGLSADLVSFRLGIFTLGAIMALASGLVLLINSLD